MDNIYRGLYHVGRRGIRTEKLNFQIRRRFGREGAAYGYFQVAFIYRKFHQTAYSPTYFSEYLSKSGRMLEHTFTDMMVVIAQV